MNLRRGYCRISRSRPWLIIISRKSKEIETIHLPKGQKDKKTSNIRQTLRIKLKIEQHDPHKETIVLGRVTSFCFTSSTLLVTLIKSHRSRFDCTYASLVLNNKSQVYIYMFLIFLNKTDFIFDLPAKYITCQSRQIH